MKTLYTILLLTAVFTFSNLHGQSIWSVVKSNEGIKFATDIIQSSDRGFIVSGFTGVNNSGSFYVLKLDEFGIKQWESTINVSNWQERSFAVSETPNGDIVIFGKGNNGNRPYVVKLDESGNTLWVSPWSEQQSFNTALQAFGTVLPNGKIVLVANTNQNTSFLYMVDSTGSLSNVAQVPDVIPAGFTSGTFVSSVETTDDGGFVLTGTTSPTASGNAFIYKFDEDGDPEWLEIYPAAESPMRFANNIVQAADGGFILTGSNGPNSESTTVLRTNAAGELSWVHVYVDTAGGFFTEGKDLIELENGQIVVVENKFSAPGSQTYYTDILLLDSMGTLLSRTPFTAGEYATSLSRIAPSIDGGYVMAGFLRNDININALDLLVVKANAAGQLPECTFACVWPGDLNNDGIVDMSDFMTLGLAFNMQGPERENAVIDFVPQSALAWNNNLPDGTNAKYADANGDGIVGIADTAGIVLNYSFVHPINNKSMSGDGAPLFFNVDEMELLEDDIVLLPLYAGHEDIPVIDFYGMFFQLQFDQQWIVPGSLKWHDGNAFSGADSDVAASLFIEYPEENFADVGITRLNQENITTFGHVATLEFRLTHSFTQLPEEGVNLDFAINFVQGHSFELDDVPFTSGQNTVHIAQLITHVPHEVSDFTPIEIFPNPYKSGTLSINSNQEVEAVHVYNVYGGLVRSMQGVHSADLSDLASGVYLLNIHLADGQLVQKKLSVQ